MDEIRRIFRSLRAKPHLTISPAGTGMTYRLLLSDQQRLDDFEKLIGFPLPSDYVSFLGEFGGAWLPGHVVINASDPQIEPDEPFSVNAFYGFYDGNRKCPDDLDYCYRMYKNRLPPAFVPFAESGENRFCISGQQETLGQIYVYCPSEFADDEDEEIFDIAPTFLDFLKGLREVPD